MAVVKVSPAGPVTLPALVTIDATGSVGGTLIDLDADPKSFAADSKALKVYFSPPGPGKYLVVVDSIALDGTTVLRAREKVVVEAVGPVTPTPQPQPTPTPSPGPSPNPPAPVTPTGVAPKWALLVWDNSNDEPSTAKLRGAPVNASVAPLGCTWSVETTTQAAKNNRAAQLAGETVPVVLFLDGSGKKVGSLPIAGPSGDGLMPGTTADDVAAKVRAMKGGQ